MSGIITPDGPHYHPYPLSSHAFMFPKTTEPPLSIFVRYVLSFF